MIASYKQKIDEKLEVISTVSKADEQAVA